LDSVYFGYWAVARNGIYFTDFGVTPDQSKPVKFFNYRNHRVIQIGVVEKNVAANNFTGFSVSPDSRCLLYTAVESIEADLMLLEHLR
jgi:hypothetical protein